MERWEDWQKPYEHGTIVIWPPDEVRAIVNAQRQANDPLSQSYCETHISVTQPLLREPSIEQWSMLEDVAHSKEPFKIRYGPLQSFLPYPCIWYQVEPAGKVLDLRSALHQTSLFNVEMKHPANFIPHMTITEGLSGPDVTENLLVALQSESGCGRFTVRALAWIVPDSVFHFSIRRTLGLGRAA